MAKIKTQLPTYTSHKEVKAFKIASIARTKAGTVLRSSVDKDGAFEVVVTDRFVRESSPRVGEYYVEYSAGSVTTVFASHFEDGYTLGESVPTSANVLENAKFGYDLWRKANPSAKILKKSPPTAYVLFREKKYEKHADKWIDAAQKL